ncbi:MULTISPECIES: S49 family peptidase [Gordonia]|jgi:signal peptide peptidase SppA|uniref:Peptidase S49 n=2 Tax=Gordonia alkanivorans TaxID=84096 RepID=W9DKT0_9ACTN|nr:MULTISPECIES: S49 family peptidase [Gordonia]AZZ80343.1 S49 family peptidase [Gordonia alkanivorans]ETA07686.1 peptidase S49 [Gordonia alkanivorans CGMCC 6845]MDH3007547.1 S49 family peptidase [Gordonia alkanivorans]MDH3022536.1 S49 family peptidase [Gordonia alkanivorans]MDH3024321.1 S49 family peptidase [Gordonia alkanivorans]
MTAGPLAAVGKKFAKSRAEHVAVVRLDGPIGAAGMGKHGLTTDTVEPVLKRAFATERLKAVVVVINSPGGSPAQSEYIAERIRQLSAEKGVPVLAFCEDVAASGGYWVACAADEIYAAHTSIVGSIGVVSSGFGFSALLDRFGVQRRLYATGENKARLDTFSPEVAEDVEWLKGLQGQLHEAFIAWVRQRRGKKLTASDEELFNGDVWVGHRAAELGLVDGIGVMRSVVAERYPDAEITVIEAPKPLLARLVGNQMSVSGLAESVTTGVMAAIDRAPAVRTGFLHRD